MQIENWLAFLSIALVATVTPGPAILLVITNSLRCGLLKASATVGGNVTGLFLMSLISVLGLSTLILYSTFAFAVIKFSGAFYLIYLGVNIWRNGISIRVEKHNKAPQSSVIKLYIQGLFVALTNPKAIIFTTALFPQFIDLEASLTFQFSILVISFMGLSALCLLAYAIIFIRFKDGIKNSWLYQYAGKAFGSIFISAGAYLATIQSR